jgi:peptidoglycan hydrolase CwlO-like protein
MKEKVRGLQEELQEALKQVNDLEVKNRELEAKLNMTKEEGKGFLISSFRRV